MLARSEDTALRHAVDGGGYHWEGDTMELIHPLLVDIAFGLVCIACAFLLSIIRITGCEFQIPQNARRLINVYAITFMP
jgi:hypothetical protein